MKSLDLFSCIGCHAIGFERAGIVELIATKPDLNDPKWGEDFKRVGSLFGEAGVAIRFVEGA
jgi:hypothetical protein